MTYVLQGDVWLTVICGIIAAAVVGDRDLAAVVGFPGLYGNVQRTGIGIPAVLDGILHDGLKSQRRHTEEGVRRVIVNDEAFGVLSLLHIEIGACVLQLRGKGDRLGACHSGEIFAQVGGEIHDHLLGLFRVLAAKTIDARHGVVDEMRPHLQHHDAGALLGDLPLLSEILLDLI